MDISRSHIFGEESAWGHKLQCPPGTYITEIFGIVGLIGQNRTRQQLLNIGIKCSNNTMATYRKPSKFLASESVPFKFVSEIGFTGLSGQLKREYGYLDLMHVLPWFSSLTVEKVTPFYEGNRSKVMIEASIDNSTTSKTKYDIPFCFDCEGEGKITGLYITENKDRVITSIQVHCGEDIDMVTTTSTTGTTQQQQQQPIDEQRNISPVVLDDKKIPEQQQKGEEIQILSSIPEDVNQQHQQQQQQPQQQQQCQLSRPASPSSIPPPILQMPVVTSIHRENLFNKLQEQIQTQLDNATNTDVYTWTCNLLFIIMLIIGMAAFIYILLRVTTGGNE